MKFIFMILLLCYVEYGFSQTNVIEKTYIPKSDNSIHKQIKEKTNKDNMINKIDSELNTYNHKYGETDSSRAYELEKNKMNIKNK